MMLYRTLDAVMPAYRELFARYELTEQQWRILRVLWEAEPLSASEVSQRTCLPSPSLVGILDRLEKKQLVSRIRSTNDRRIVHVTLTGKGRALGEEIAPQVSNIHDQLKAQVSDQDWQVLAGLLQSLQYPNSAVSKAAS